MPAESTPPQTVLEQDPGLIEAAQSMLTGSAAKLPSPVLLASLLALEKTDRPHSPPTFAKFVGLWRLCWVTGPPKPHQYQSTVTGKGYYIPRWATLQIEYVPGNPTDYGPQSSDQVGQIANQVQIGGLGLVLTGPARCWAKKNILVFDFTRVEIKVWGKTLYKGFIRGGHESEQTFWHKHVRTQAFFVFFLTNDRVLAARGRGGGLALWAKTDV